MHHASLWPAERRPRAIATSIGLLLTAVACSKSPADSARTTSEPRVVTFDELSNWKYTDGFDGMPATVKALHQQRIALTGYVMCVLVGDNRMNRDSPFELLVVKRKSYDRHSCDGPERNEMVTVTPAEGTLAPDAGRRVRMVGTFRVESIKEDGWCIQIYGLRADTIEVVR